MTHGMKVSLALALSHDGEVWVAKGAGLSEAARGDTLEALDADLCTRLRENESVPAGTRVSVSMGFDFDVLPTWLRQYHSHYFNRRVVLTV